MRLVFAVVAALVLSTPASAYYHWVFFNSGNAPFNPVPARFDLSALKDNTVQYFIAEQGPAAVMSGDTQQAFLNRIHQAAAVWNSVPSSSLRLRFGGFLKTDAVNYAPGIEIVFSDSLAPGILAQTKPVFPAKPFEASPDASFVPILRSTIQLRSNLAATGLEQPSYSDEVFLTLVHEFGHALGLQHTLTSSTMSTAITRAARKGFALSADDIAAVSSLYPAPRQAKLTGVISGRVAGANGKGLNLASVVALSSISGVAVSAMTNPDGTYRLEGLPIGTYYLYAHPLPPALSGEMTPANIVAPVDATGKSYPADTAFATRFYPNTVDWSKARQFAVTPGSAQDKIDFALPARSGPAIHSMETYGYEDGVPVPAAPLLNNTRHAVVFHAIGTTANNDKEMAAGLAANVIGNAAAIEAGTLRYYTQGFLQMTLATAGSAQPKPVALAATLNDDLYVLPAAFTVVTSGPPLITDMTPWYTSLGAPMLSIRGSNLHAATSVWFDGVPGKLAAAYEDGSLLVSVPPGPSAYVATVEAVNSDGQSSLQALGNKTRAEYSYLANEPAAIAPGPGQQIAGRDGWMLIGGIHTHFVQGQTMIGFASSDVAVRSVWVYGPEFLVANVSINAGAKPGRVPVTATTGLETVTLAEAIEIAPVIGGQVSIQLPIVNQSTGLAGVPAGGQALIRVSGLPADLTSGLKGWALAIGGKLTPFKVVDATTLSAVIPADLTVGAQGVQLASPNPALTPGGVTPLFLQIDLAPPTLLSAAAIRETATAVNPTSAAKAGDRVVLNVSGLNQPGELVAALESVHLTIAGIDYPVDTITPGPAEYKFINFIWFTVPHDLPFDAAEKQAKFAVTVTRGTRQSPAFSLDVAAAK